MTKHKKITDFVIEWFPLTFLYLSIPLHLMEVHLYLPKAVNVIWFLIFLFFTIKIYVRQIRWQDEMIYQRGLKDGRKSKSKS